MENKQTAVEWLKEQFYNYPITPNNISDWLTIAKDIEKKHLEQKYNEGIHFAMKSKIVKM